MTVMPFEPGIYFDLPAAQYHADSAFGSTTIKELCSDPYEWQFKRINGDLDKDTAALQWGSAIHTRVLEGRSAFEASYYCALKKEDYPDALVTMDDLRQHAKILEIKLGKTKSEIIQNIRERDKTTLIWEQMTESHEERNKGKQILPEAVFEEIEQAAQWMQQDPKLEPIMKDGQIVEGAAEVSIFYMDNGIRRKARYDRVLPHTLIDLKSFRPPVGWRVHDSSINRILGRVIAQNRYDIQAADYVRAWKFARELFHEKKLFWIHQANDVEKKLFEMAVEKPVMDWNWILVKNSGAPECFVRTFPTSSMTFQAASIEIDQALEKYRSLVEKFGEDKYWPPQHFASEFDDTDFPTYLGL